MGELWQRIKDGAWAAVTGIPRAILWTAGLFGLSYGLGKMVDDKGTWDFLHVAKAVENKEPGAAIGSLAQMAAMPLAISTGLSGIMGAVTTQASATPPANLPRANDNNPQRIG